jgi:hypothetical protein
MLRWLVVFIDAQRLIVLKTLVKWYIASWKLRLALLSRGTTSGARSLFGRALCKTTTLQRSVTGEEGSAIKTFAFIFNDGMTFVSNKVAIWPVSTIKFGEYEHTLVANFESTCSGDLHVVGV